MQRLVFDQAFALPPEQVFDYFAEHENLDELLGAKITRLRDGTDGHRNGVGSTRQLKVGPVPPFEETVTVYEPHELIEYEITRGSPLKDHHGSMRFTPEGDGTNLHYEISFASKLPGVDLLVAQGLRRNVSKGLASAPGAR
jgi:uncharacterized protein YndB with AHSA1/START domain